MTAGASQSTAVALPCGTAHFGGGPIGVSPTPSHWPTAAQSKATRIIGDVSKGAVEMPEKPLSTHALFLEGRLLGRPRPASCARAECLERPWATSARGLLAGVSLAAVPACRSSLLQSRRRRYARCRAVRAN